MHNNNRTLPKKEFARVIEKLYNDLLDILLQIELRKIWTF
jgi:hypothetical protein